jgi:hypothetical protein
MGAAAAAMRKIKSFGRFERSAPPGRSPRGGELRHNFAR